MPKRADTKLRWSLASVALNDAYTDFILSRQAMNCTPATLVFYRYTAGEFLKWIENTGVTDPRDVTARHVRGYLTQLRGNRGHEPTDHTKHDHARAIKTLLRFWHKEGYTQTLVPFDMPRIAKKRQPVLTAAQLTELVKVCNVRDRAVLLFMADSGLRRQEVINLNWKDVDMETGLVQVLRGKGRKDRSAVIGATTRRALLAYRRTLKKADSQLPTAPLFQTRSGRRFKGCGLLRIFQSLTERTGIHVTAHAMRRTFTILSLRAGMDPLYLQNLAGWEDLTMLNHYAQMEDIDLLQAHKAHSPVDNLDRLK